MEIPSDIKIMNVFFVIIIVSRRDLKTRRWLQWKFTFQRKAYTSLTTSHHQMLVAGYYWYGSMKHCHRGVPKWVWDLQTDIIMEMLRHTSVRRKMKEIQNGHEEEKLEDEVISKSTRGWQGVTFHHAVYNYSYIL